MKCPPFGEPINRHELLPARASAIPRAPPFHAPARSRSIFLAEPVEAGQLAEVDDWR